MVDHAVFAPQYFGSVYYYAAMAGCRRAVVDVGLRYDKRFKSVHRCTIVDTRAPLTLTVPVSRPADGPVGTWSRMTVSPHGQWWADHLVSLESAYGRTPYFEFYIDRFKPWLADTRLSVTAMDAGIDRVVRAALSIDTEVEYRDASSAAGIPCSEDDSSPADWRRTLPDGLVHDVPYWQVRASRLGFTPGLSILDLIFNMGPEAPLVLRDMTLFS